MPTKSEFTKKTILAFSALLLVTIILFTVLCSSAVRAIDADAARLVDDSSELSSSITSSLLDSYLNQLKIIAVTLSNNDELSDSDISILKDTLVQKSPFTSLGITYIDDDGFATDSQLFTAGNNQTIKTAFSGRRSVAYIDNDMSYKKEYFLMTAPVLTGLTVTSVVYAKLTKDQFLENYSPEAFTKGAATTYIINNRMGSLIDKSAVQPLEEFSKLTKDQKDQVYDLLANHVFPETIIKNGSTYLCFRPLNIDGFHLLTIMKASAVMHDSKQIILFILLGLTLFVAIFFLSVFLIISHYNKSRRRMRDTSLELELVMSNIPGGVVRFNCDRNYTIRFLNDGLLSLTGYAYKDMQTVIRNSFINFIHKDDRLKFVKMFENQVATGVPIEMDCRLMKKDGSFSWFLIKGNTISRDETCPSCLCVLTDISTMKQAEHELNITMQRYSVIIEQSDSIIFEYSFVDDTMYLSGKWSEKFDFDAKANDFFNTAIKAEFIHPNDVKKATDIFNAVQKGASYRKADVRLKSINGEYIWCTIRASAIFDEEGNTYKTVGRIVDVDKQYHETECLKKQAELDSLTGIYNKGTTQMLIDNFLQNEGRDAVHALLILDIDNFKRVNDTLGHLVGDTVIADITARCRSLLRSGDIFGRIGGDEFVILLKYAGDLGNVKSKAEELCHAFVHTICGDGPSIDVSGSIGIAFSGKGASTYKLLVDKADTALYEAKKNGKNQYSIYGL